jgi:hypothetical protein
MRHAVFRSGAGCYHLLVMLKRALIAVLLFTSLALSADDRAFLDAVSRPVLYDVPGTKNVRVQKDVIYRREPQRVW